MKTLKPPTATTEAPEPPATALFTQPKNPLHGITLEAIVTALQAHYGWAGLAERIPVNCFSPVSYTHLISCCSVTNFEDGVAIEGFLCRFSGYIPPAAPGRKATPQTSV